MWSRRTTLYPEKSSRVQGNLEEVWTFNNPDLNPSLGTLPKSELPSHGLLTTLLQKDRSWGEHSCKGWLWLLVMGYECSWLLQRWQSVKLSVRMVFVCRLLRDNELEVFQSCKWMRAEQESRRDTSQAYWTISSHSRAARWPFFSLLWVLSNTHLLWVLFGAWRPPWYALKCCVSSPCFWISPPVPSQTQLRTHDTQNQTPLPKGHVSVRLTPIGTWR